ncbi:NUDIX domain-containing protein [Polaromonas sp.]|nr:NUDIX domain-containing protein [Candidatus Saccharibacteria bacterium]
MPHIHELYDFTITVYIVHEDKVLLVNHPRYDKWIPIGGHIELDEDPEMALYREIDEETGLNVRILSTKPSFDSPYTKQLLTPNYIDAHEANPPHKHISFIYFGIADTAALVLSDEHDDMRWLSTLDLQDERYSLSPDVIFYSEAAIKLAATMT